MYYLFIKSQAISWNAKNNHSIPSNILIGLLNDENLTLITWRQWQWLSLTDALKILWVVCNHSMMISNGVYNVNNKSRQERKHTLLWNGRSWGSSSFSWDMLSSTWLINTVTATFKKLRFHFSNIFLSQHYSQNANVLFFYSIKRSWC